MKIINAPIRRADESRLLGASPSDVNKAQTRRILRKQERARAKAFVQRELDLEAKLFITNAHQAKVDKKRKDAKAFWDFMDSVAGGNFVARRQRHQRTRKSTLARTRYDAVVDMTNMPDFETRTPVFAIQDGHQVMLASVALEDEAFA